MRLAVSILGQRNNPHLAAFEPAATALTAALKQLGHQVDRIRTDGPAVWSQYERVVVLGAIHAKAVGFELPANAVVYNLEQAGSAWFDAEYRALLSRLPWWDYNSVNAETIATSYSVPYPRANVPVADTNPSALVELGRAAAICHEDYPIDVAFVGWLNDRRCGVIDRMRYLGLRVEVVDGTGGPDDYGQHRRGVLTNCKLLVNVHFYQAAIFESSRAAYALANRVPMISEHSVHLESWAENGVSYAPLELLPKLARELVRDPEFLTLNAMVERGRLALQQYAPKYVEQVRRALAAIA